jgi:hypothetical protein
MATRCETAWFEINALQAEMRKVGVQRAIPLGPFDQIVVTFRYHTKLRFEHRHLRVRGAGFPDVRSAAERPYTEENAPALPCVLPQARPCGLRKALRNGLQTHARGRCGFFAP